VFLFKIKIDQQLLDNQIRPLNVFLHHLLEQLEQIDDYHYFANPVDEAEVKDFVFEKTSISMDF
jgi:hypothetical protein